MDLLLDDMVPLPSAAEHEAAAAQSAEQHEIRDVSHSLAMAVLGGRYRSAKQAMESVEFRGADEARANEILKNMASDPTARSLAVETEAERLGAVARRVALAEHQHLKKRQDILWLEARFSVLLDQASADALLMADHVVSLWAWSFAEAKDVDKRYFA